MNVKSPTAIDSLDEELNIFEEDEWDFFAVTENDENYEFFNDIRDADFIDKHSKVKLILPLVVFGLLIAVCGVWLTATIHNKEKVAVESMNKQLESGITYIDGEDADGDTVIRVSQSMKAYTEVLQSGKGYENLIDLCQNNSTFYDSYTSQLSAMRETLDTHDCYARMVTAYGQYVRCSKVDRVIRKDGILYAYVNLNVPDKSSIYEWIHLYKYNVTKFFTNKEVNEKNIVQFLLDTMKQNAVPCKDTVLCLEFTEDGKLIDDTQLLGVCTNAYNYSIAQMTQVIGAGGISG